MSRPQLQRPKRLTQFEAKFGFWDFALCAVPFGVGLAFAAMIAQQLQLGLPLLFLAAPMLLIVALYALQQRQLSGEKLWRRTKLPLWTRLRFGAESVAQTCGYCRDALDDAAEHTCPDCRVVYHAECADELGGCGTVGCASARDGRVRLVDPKRAAVKS